MLHSDTHPDARRVQADILRRMGVAGRAALADAMCRDARRLALAGIRNRRPGASEAEILEAYTRLVLPAALAEAVVRERARRVADG